ncbi:hypothetical protein CTI12_AA498610 [Artemisia annua]|uniref:GTD-binding domain-containing protein n=1 Tax=Artemisia annua TaxID=35608 RepID=A0A2U1LER5_ARTAN|nr:hypothetical protein CTI12_AA498610 [Artemisia annua]
MKRKRKMDDVYKYADNTPGRMLITDFRNTGLYDGERRNIMGKYLVNGLVLIHMLVAGKLRATDGDFSPNDIVNGRTHYHYKKEADEVTEIEIEGREEVESGQGKNTTYCPFCHAFTYVTNNNRILLDDMMDISFISSVIKNSRGACHSIRRTAAFKCFIRISSEKSAYDEEEMNILKEIILRREREKHFLEKEVEAYRQMTHHENDQFYRGDNQDSNEDHDLTKNARLYEDAVADSVKEEEHEKTIAIVGEEKSRGMEADVATDSRVYDVHIDHGPKSSEKLNEAKKQSEQNQSASECSGGLPPVRIRPEQYVFTKCANFNPLKVEQGLSSTFGQGAARCSGDRRQVLCYELGHSCSNGSQLVSLTEIISTHVDKKAYIKAILCVQPDELRGFQFHVYKKRKMSGFGHRMYKNYDPRAKVIKKLGEEVFSIVGRGPLIETSIHNRAVGFPTEFFPDLFAIPRMGGYLSHLRESLDDPDTEIMRTVRNCGTVVRYTYPLPRMNNIISSSITQTPKIQMRLRVSMEVHLDVFDPKKSITPAGIFSNRYMFCYFWSVNESCYPAAHNQKCRLISRAYECPVVHRRLNLWVLVGQMIERFLLQPLPCSKLIFHHWQVPNVTDVGLNPRAVKKVNVIGVGLMGSGVAKALLISNIFVVLNEVNSKEKYIEGKDMEEELKEHAGILRQSELRRKEDEKELKVRHDQTITNLLCIDFIKMCILPSGSIRGRCHLCMWLKFNVTWISTFVIDSWDAFFEQRPKVLGEDKRQ